MARQQREKTASNKKTAAEKQPADPFARLTWDDAEEWAGSTIVDRGRSYRSDGAVHDLARTVDGALLAWVYGTQRYVTRVTIGKGKRLESECTCPYGATCKHAVAVVLTYLDHLKEKRPVGTAREDDPLLRRLEEGAEIANGFDEDWGEEDWGEEHWGEGEEGEEEEETDTKVATAAGSSSKKSSPLREYLQELTKAELVSLLEETARECPEVRQLLEDRQIFLSSRTRTMLRTVRREIGALDEPVWDEYGHGRPVANLDRLEKYLHALVEAGQADDILRLGPELLQAGSRAVQHEYAGESAYDLGCCLDIVFRALTSSSLSPVEQLEWSIEMAQADEHGLCDDGIDKLWETGYTKPDWSTLADRLQKRLDELQAPGDADGFEDRYHRDQLSNWLISALEKAGREDEVIPLCEREAPLTGSYLRLVDRLIAASRWEKAARWCRHGIEDTDISARGIGFSLRERLLTISEKTGDRLRAVAFRADSFFSFPSLNTFQQLCRAARKARVGKAVEAWARRFLETGRKPAGAVNREKRESAPALDWPLPDTGVPPQQRVVPEAPMTDVLIEIAIDEKKTDDIIKWHDHARRRAGAGGYMTRYYSSLDLQVAEAIKKTHPDRAVEVWKAVAEGHIDTVQVKGYRAARPYLRAVKDALTGAGQKEKWDAYLDTLRQKNKRRPRCVEMLDRLEGMAKRIIDS